MAQTQAVEDKVEEQQDRSGSEEQKTQVQSAEFAEAAQTTTSGPGTSINLLLDMNVPVTVAVGRTEIPIQRLLQLGPGSVIKLDKSIDAPADLYLKDSRFATGTIVIVNEKFAVRIKEIFGSETAETDNKK
jgi:flagellar motor switch protein FliN/FliY